MRNKVNSNILVEMKRDTGNQKAAFQAQQNPKTERRAHHSWVTQPHSEGEGTPGVTLCHASAPFHSCLCIPVDKEFANFLTGIVPPPSTASAATFLLIGPKSGPWNGICPASQTDSSCFSIIHGACPSRSQRAAPPPASCPWLKREDGDDGVQRNVMVCREPLSCSSLRLGLLLPGIRPGQNFVHRDVRHRGRTPMPTNNNIAQEMDGTNQCTGRHWGLLVKLLKTWKRLVTEPSETATSGERTCRCFANSQNSVPYCSVPYSYG